MELRVAVSANRKFRVSRVSREPRDSEGTVWLRSPRMFVKLFFICYTGGTKYISSFTGHFVIRRFLRCLLAFVVSLVYSTYDILAILDVYV